MELEKTLRKMIYSIKEDFNQYSDDNFFSDEHLMYLIDTLREDYIDRTYSNPAKVLPESLYVKLCMELEEYPNSCSEDVNILRTKLPLPNYFMFPGRSYLKHFSLGSVMLKYVNRIEIERVPYFKASRFSSSQLYYSIDGDGRLLIISSDRTLLNESVSVNMIPRSFEETLKFRCGPCQENEENDCLDIMDIPYPIDGTIHTVILNTLKQQIYTKFNIVEDKVNDGDNTQQTPHYPTKNYRRNVDRDANRED